MKKIAIVGAGLSGLLLANLLSEQSKVVVFEKSRGVGGRLATKYTDRYEFDHGAQYFVAKSRDFQLYCQKLLEAGVIAPWHANFAQFDGSKLLSQKKWDDDFPHYVGAPKMTSIGKFLSAKIDVSLVTKIVALERTGSQWSLLAEDGRKFDGFDWVILAIPPQQALALLQPYDLSLKNDLVASLMLPCATLLLGFEHDPIFFFDAMYVKHSPISWISQNHTKPGRKKNYSVVIHSSHDWAALNQSSPQDVLINVLTKEAANYCKHLLQPDFQFLHFWRYAKVAKNNPRHLMDEGLGIAVCGDWTYSGKVEGAFLSAWTTFNELCRLLKEKS